MTQFLAQNVDLGFWKSLSPIKFLVSPVSEICSLYAEEAHGSAVMATIECTFLRGSGGCSAQLTLIQVSIPGSWPISQSPTRTGISIVFSSKLWPFVPILESGDFSLT